MSGAASGRLFHGSVAEMEKRRVNARIQRDGVDRNALRLRLGATSKLTNTQVLHAQAPLVSHDSQKVGSKIVIGCGRPFHFPSLRGSALRTYPPPCADEGKISLSSSFQAVYRRLLQSKKPKSLMESGSTGVRGFCEPYEEISKMSGAIKVYSDVTISYDRRGNY
jgi:hypothetical protein